MKRVLRPGYTPIQQYLEIAKTKGDSRDTLYSLFPHIEAAYLQYEQACPNFHVITGRQFSSEERIALLGAYNGSTRALDLFWHDIMSRAHSGLCCYCLMDPSTSADHVLPKEDFAEFSVLNLNLVPSCQTCNGKKGTKVAANGLRLFFHAYTEIVEDVCWLDASVEIQAGVPTLIYKLNTATIVSPAFRTLVERQYQELELLRRYGQRFAANGLEEARRQLRIARSYSDGGPVIIQKALQATAAGYLADHGKNHYLAVGFAALAQVPQAFAY